MKGMEAPRDAPSDAMVFICCVNRAKARAGETVLIPHVASSAVSFSWNNSGVQLTIWDLGGQTFLSLLS